MTNLNGEHDTDDDGTIESDIDNASTQTESLNNADIANAASGEVPQAQGDGTLSMGEVSGGGGGGSYDTTISSASGLESKSGSFSAGERVWVEQPDTPYELSSWIEIDTSNVVLDFASRVAADGNPITTIASGTNVGGVRIGENAASQVEDVVVRRHAIDGNTDNQDQSIKYLHGVHVKNARHVHIDRCYQTRTSPYREHGTGGSGVTLAPDTEKCTVTRNIADDVGDRGIQCAGWGHRIENNINLMSYDRAISTDLAPADDGNDYAAGQTVVSRNWCQNMTNGSGIGTGVNPSGDRNYRNVYIANTCYGEMGLGLTIKAGASHEVVANNSVIHTSESNGSGILMDCSRSVCSGNYVHNAAKDGIRCQNQTLTVTGNVINQPTEAGIEHRSQRSTIANNVIWEAGGYAIDASGGPLMSVVGNWAHNTDGMVFSGNSVVAMNVQENCQMYGYDLEGNNIQCIGNYIAQSGFDDGQTGYRANGEQVILGFNQAGEGEALDIEIGANGVDVQIWGHHSVRNVIDNGARTRWDGWIGGGPLGGVDLSTVNGQWEGDRAVADGTSTADAGDEASWDPSNTQWRVFQPSTTV